jgi:hypothetical protein
MSVALRAIPHHSNFFTLDNAEICVFVILDVGHGGVLSLWVGAGTKA